MIQTNSASLIDKEIKERYVVIKKKSATSSDIKPALYTQKIQYSLSAGWQWFREIQPHW